MRGSRSVTRGSRRAPQLVVDDDGGKTERAKDNVLRLLAKDGVSLEGPHDPRLRPSLGEISSEEAHSGRGMLTTNEEPRERCAYSVYETTGNSSLHCIDREGRRNETRTSNPGRSSA